MKTCKLYLNYAGYCEAKAHHAVKRDPKSDIKFHALFGLIFHPEQGWILFDTGYTDRFFEATTRLPNKIYALITKVNINKKDEVKSQLEAFGINPSDIKHIIISHFHADHLGGLKDFDNATIYCSKKAYTEVKEISKFFGFTKGILHDLIPSDIEDRVEFIDEIRNKIEDEIFENKYDLFNDESIYVFDLPGHARGQLGIQLQTEKAKYFLVADACWDYRSYRDLALPNQIVRLFFDNWKDYVSTVSKLQKFNQSHPEFIIVPTHCAKTTSNLVTHKFDIDAL
jgi:glyoxylase-like metal-dependent hydrolase (beta-lactamase superfamily II)